MGAPDERYTIPRRDWSGQGYSVRPGHAEWRVLALVPAFLLALFGQKYVIRGLRI